MGIISLSAGSFVGVVIMVVALHMLLLVLHYGATAPFPVTFPPPVRIAVVLMCSEKTLPIAMAVLSFLPAKFGDPGVIAVPCILGHLCQLLIDAVVATKWAAKYKPLDESKNTPEGTPQVSDDENPIVKISDSVVDNCS